MAILLALAFLAVFLVTAALQLPQSRNYLKNEITTAFNRQFEGNLTLQEFQGFLPFRPEVTGGRVYSPADSSNPVLSFESASITVNWWELLQQNITINSFDLEKPVIHLGFDGEKLNLLSAFEQKDDVKRPSFLTTGDARLINRLNIFAPSLTISDGEAYLDSTIQLPERLQLSTPLAIENLNTSIFLEITELQFFADILNFNADIPQSDYGQVSINGQFFNGNQFFELNGFQISTAIASLNFSLEASEVDLFEPSLGDQFRQADYEIEINTGYLQPEFITKILPDFPIAEQTADLEISASGNANELFIDRLHASLGESTVILTGDLHQLLNQNFSYNVSLENLVMSPDEKQWLSEYYLNGIRLDRYDVSTIRGNVHGSLNEINADLRTVTASGRFALDGYLDFSDINYELLAEADSMDISPFLNDTSKTTMLQGIIAVTGQGIGEEASVNTSLNLNTSTIAGYTLETLIAELSYASKQYDYSIRADDGNAFVQTYGQFRFQDGYYTVTAEGQLEHFDIKPYYPQFHADSTNFNSTFSANLQGSDIEDIYGRISLEMGESVIGQDSLRAHQLYADLDSPENKNRTLRFTSSFFDGELIGSIRPGLLRQMGKHWSRYLQRRLKEEILFAETAPDDSTAYFTDDESPTADLSLQMNVKDLALLKKYIPHLPEISSKARFSTSVNATREQLLITGTFFDDYFNSDLVTIENLNSSLSAAFRHKEELKEFSTIDFQLNSDSISYNDLSFKDNFINLSMRDDTVQLHQGLVQSANNLQLQSDYTATLHTGNLEIIVNKFDLGTSQYSWQTFGTPRILYTNQETLVLDKVALISDSGFIEADGIFSSSYDDSVQYTIEDLDLNRISDLINGRIGFSGNMNGQFTTRTLSQIPSIQGNIDIVDSKINNRTIGDVTLTSELNSEENQFDTQVRVYTDPQKYTDYYVENDSTGHDILLSGYFKLPDEAEPDEDLFYFDADLKEIDMWIVTFIAPTVIADMEGSSSGTGILRGNRDDFDFDARFEIIDVYGKPVFTNVGYTLNGELDFNKTDGLIFRDIEVADSRGGYGLLSGQVDLQNFQPPAILDLTLDLNNLHFMNNPYDPDVPFYASLFGTGQARITGSTFDPYLRTSTPVSISSDSRISIPIEDETEFERDRRFIQFVDTFDLDEIDQRAEVASRQNNESENNETELTFTERFTMDLQFNTSSSVNVELIFDRVTNEVLSANGNGQVRLLLEDQNVSMFGNFNIEDGEYLFVSGDIFTRNFNLEEGGTINWQGNIADAGLDVTAVYRARPSFSSLTAASAQSATEDVSQRVPVDLVLEITGSLNAIENDFYFRLPSGLDGISDPTIATQINNLNQNENNKLLQATSILLSGNFMPSDQTQGLTLGNNFSGTAAVVNPLISSQVINPLLSNQINSLLSSDVTFDVDFNLNAFNEVDLGVALRLFDDRVILRREGQVTGEQSAIGDLGATYRINRTFSLTAFHRQDPTLTNTSEADTRQTQEMNGIGLEAQVQFNTWQNLRERISNGLRTLLGLKPEDDENELENSEENIEE